MNSQKRKDKQAIPLGFRAPPKPKFNVMTMTVRELQDHWRRNDHVLSTTSSTSSASYVPRLREEQAAIEARLEELGFNALENDLEQMTVSDQQSPRATGSLSTKRRILASLSQSGDPAGKIGPSAIASLGFAEAIELERKAHLADLEKRRRDFERRQKYGMPGPNEILTREEREARIWAFMNHKPSDSDLEDDEDEDDDDPELWFEDEEDDGRKGQDIVDPDVPDDLSYLIRIDESRIHRFTSE